MLEAFFANTHLPLAEQLPGLVKIEVSRVAGKPGGDSRFHMMVELYFERAEEVWRALASESGVRLLAELKAWEEAGLITWFYADSWSEDKSGGGVAAES